MNRTGLALITIMGVMTWGGLAAGQESAQGGPVAHMVVTLEPHKGKEVPAVNADDVMVYEGKDRDRVVDWVPATGDHAALELFVVLDDGSGLSLSTQLEDLRKFIAGQPATAKVGVAYMQDGVAKVVQELTSDHAVAAKALRLPMGIRNGNASPYISLSDLIKKWPATTARREVVVASDGIDPYYLSPDLEDPYLNATIDQANRAGIVFSAIYTPGVGHFGHSYWLTYWGQMYLAELAEKTGGEAYYIGFTGAPVAFTPYLEDIANRLEHQYLLTFVPKPEKKSGFQPVRLRTEVGNVDLVSAGRVWVEAAAK